MSENQPGTDRPITTTIEAPEPCRRVVKAEIARTFFDQEYADRLKKAARKHHRPGFRKGHTPRALVERELGDALRMETVEALVPKAWMTAVMEHRLSPVNDPALENLEFKEDGPLRFDLVVEVRPDIVLGDLSGLPVKRRQVAIGETDIDQVIERIRESRATWETVSQAAADGDQVTLDLVPGDAEGVFDEDRVIADQRLVLGAEHNLEAFNTQMSGCEAGQQKIIDVDYPADHQNPSMQGRNVKFRCHIRQVAQKRLPAVDDAFAAATGATATVSALRADIRRDLEKEASRRVAEELDAQLQSELLKRHDVPVPSSMVEKYLESGLAELHQRNLRQGRANSEAEDLEYREVGRSHAERALRGMLLMEAVRRQEAIKVSAEDVDNRIAEIAVENGFDIDRYREFVESGEEKERIRYDLAERRTCDFLLTQAVIKDVPADTDVLTEEEQ